MTRPKNMKMETLQTMNAKLTTDEIRKLETQIVEGAPEKIRPYVNDAVLYCLSDQAELIRRKAFTRKNNLTADVDGIHMTAILAVVTRDRQLWNHCINVLSENVLPSLGHTAFTYLSKQTIEQEVLEDWRFLISYSAKLGYVQSKQFVFEAQAKRLGSLWLASDCAV